MRGYDAVMPKHEVVIYTTTYSQESREALRFLTHLKRVRVQEIDLTGQLSERRKLAERTGERWLPQVFVGETHVGNYLALRDLDARGGLDSLLHPPPPETEESEIAPIVPEEDRVGGTKMAAVDFEVEGTKFRARFAPDRQATEERGAPVFLCEVSRLDTRKLAHTLLEEGSSMTAARDKCAQFLFGVKNDAIAGPRS